MIYNSILLQVQGVAEVCTHMLDIPTVVWQPPELWQLGMSGNCFSAENHISLAQASHRPAHHSFKFTNV